jgi:GNAT superfamily N-acetyltransferase
VHPPYRRRGIGGRLIQQGIDLADTKGYISFLEASPMGKELYERYGYTEIDSFALDLSKYRVPKCSEPELYTTSLMLREPREKTT